MNNYKRFACHCGQDSLFSFGTEEVACAFCGASFASIRKRKFCSNECQRKNQKKPFTELAWQKGKVRVPCLHCGKLTSRHDTKGFCSRECASSYATYKRKYDLYEANRLGFNDTESDKKLAIKKLIAKLRRLVFMKNHMKVCVVCGKAFQRDVSRKGSTKFCSEECRKSVKKSLGISERCKKFGVPFQKYIHKVQIFKRDGWRCKLCGRPTPRKLMGTIEPNAPTIDHIIPLSKGGGHTWDNVQCACWECNCIIKNGLNKRPRFALEG